MNEIQNKFQSSTFIPSRLVRSPGKALFCAQALLIALAGCSNDSGGSNGGGGDGNSGGSSGETAQGGNGGTQATGGTSGSQTGGQPNAGAGGTSDGAGGESGSTSGGAGGAVGGSGGTDTGVAPACAVTVGDNAAGLGVTRTEISTRKVGNSATGEVMRIERDPSTGDIIYMNRGGQFWKLDVVTGTSTSVDLGFGGGNDCRSMTFASDGTLYVQCHNGGGISVIIKKGVPGAGGRTWTTLVTSDGYPAGNTNFDHSFNGIIVSPDDQYVYFASGSRTDHGEVEQGIREVPLTSAVFRVPASSTDLHIANTDDGVAPYLFADGTRNAFDLAFNPAGDLIAIDNGPDIDFPDELNWIQEGKHYGFPWRMGDQGNPNMDPTYDKAGDQRLHGALQAVQNNTYFYDPAFPAAPQGVTFTDPIKNLGPDNDKFCVDKGCQVIDASDTGTAFYGITGHRSPLGLNFDAKGKLCGDYYKAGFVVSYGAVVPLFGDGGQDVSLVQLTKVGDAYETHITKLVSDMIAPIDSVLVDNKLYVIEYRPNGGGGNIYEITFPLPAN